VSRPADDGECQEFNPAAARDREAALACGRRFDQDMRRRERHGGGDRAAAAVSGLRDQARGEA
jgi:hypothetical protein